MSTRGIGEVVGGFLGGPVGSFIGGFVDDVIGGNLPCIFQSCNSKSHPPFNSQPFQNAKQVAELAIQTAKSSKTISIPFTYRTT